MVQSTAEQPFSQMLSTHHSSCSQGKQMPGISGNRSPSAFRKITYSLCPVPACTVLAPTAAECFCRVLSPLAAELALSRMIHKQMGSCAVSWDDVVTVCSAKFYTEVMSLREEVGQTADFVLCMVSNLIKL
ncbi:hypothetical protein Y1Q_0016378 [Alligator mississippiensis]|uniref:Uncharacterized protein n=1 Tax=Alligator mississippiensis TaxID=8496 RepID=A0A151N301_ALLMI|nr:hypothetical protein Y1Q_0016378 [Alligator mississippiensis]